MKEAFKRVADIVREMIPRVRYTISREEADLGVHLRGNTALYNSLLALINARLRGRASVPEPTDPAACKSIVARDRELLWLLGRLEFIFTSPVNSPAEVEREQPD